MIILRSTLAFSQHTMRHEGCIRGFGLTEGTMKPEIWVSIYAAIVGTGALLLNFKNWLDSGPRIKLSLIPEGIIVGGDPKFDDKDIVIVTAINRGNSPTTINNLQLHEMPTWMSRLRRRPTRCFIIPNPQPKGYPPNVPFELAPFKSWNGVLRKRQGYVPDLYTGTF